MSLLTEIIKAKYSQEGYLPNYPPHLISDEEMCDAFLPEEAKEGVAYYFYENYPLINKSLKKEYDTLISALRHHIRLFLQDEDTKVDLPDWVYCYMLGEVVSINSLPLDRHYLLTGLGVDNIDDIISEECQWNCVKMSKRWVNNLPKSSREIEYVTNTGKINAYARFKVAEELTTTSKYTVTIHALKNFDDPSTREYDETSSDYTCSFKVSYGNTLKRELVNSGKWEWLLNWFVANHNLMDNQFDSVSGYMLDSEIEELSEYYEYDTSAVYRNVIKYTDVEHTEVVETLYILEENLEEYIQDLTCVIDYATVYRFVTVYYSFTGWYTNKPEIYTKILLASGSLFDFSTSIVTSDLDLWITTCSARDIKEKTLTIQFCDSDGIPYEGKTQKFIQGTSPGSAMFIATASEGQEFANWMLTPDGKVFFPWDSKIDGTPFIFRPYTMFGEPHIIKLIRLESPDIVGL